MLHFNVVNQRRNISWEDYVKQVYYDPARAESFTEVDKLFIYVQEEGKYDISKYKIRK
jgi:hypothetical protein